MSILRLIGDVHGKYSQYLQLIQDVEYSIQLGDMGFDYSLLKNVDSKKHKILAGNHDNYDNMDYPHFLGNFGVYKVEETEFFFVRGGFSIDKALRIPRISWWEEEELTWQEMNDCVELYRIVKPTMVLSHECPSEILPYICTNTLKLTPSVTSGLLNELWTLSQPFYWCFAHHHKNWLGELKNTRFQCLDELTYANIEI